MKNKTLISAAVAALIAIFGAVQIYLSTPDAPSPAAPSHAAYDSDAGV